MNWSINTEIALTYLIARPKQTIVAALGVTFGIGMYIFMNSLITGTNNWSEKIMLNSTPHLRIHKDNSLVTNEMMNQYLGLKHINIISNPQFAYSDNRITNPDKLLSYLKANPQVIAISKQVFANVIYTHGNVAENGNLQGVNILEQDKMFDISSTMQIGRVKDLANNPNAVIIGIGLAEKLNLKVGDYLGVTAGNSVFKRLEVVGIFKTTIKAVDNAKCYTNIATIQQLLRRDRTYITDIFINIKNHTKTAYIASIIEQNTGYNVETWQQNNEQSLAGKMIRDIIANAVVVTILLVAGFGIYNILNMVIYEKIKEIAILKATGFQGNHVIEIFIKQAIMIGFIGSFSGAILGYTISFMVSKIYIGVGSITYLPVTFLIKHYIQGIIFGLLTTFFAGYIPAIRASKIDPVQIIRG
ncbi:lipoprotein-releasing system permease protein [Flexibacter flexilis DSM 6793]|uniref:Lipoprotein-releasing system permease protein n=1 Tax=Flexibacter flexilis DSM 6793 TaxID=927664 RepID=A0A1I1GYH0_9BACT|nr:FtsX-like permease family protein [Flexibacter flexilis]SFC14000.1 lipoprotein-releasing system permease protein [Flexibacter flexilis DSM 6793]